MNNQPVHANRAGGIESLPDLLEELGFDVVAVSAADEFLSSGALDRTDCLILDVAMPGMKPTRDTAGSTGRAIYPIASMPFRSSERSL